LKSYGLRQVPQQFVHLFSLFADIVTADLGAALEIANEANKDFHGCCFAGAIGSNIAENFAFVYVQSYIV
jgi:hypothetical protein